MARRFLAIPLPDALRATLLAIAPVAASGVRPVDPDGLHLTLHFLGGYSAQEKPPFRTMGRHCSGGWDATIPVHGKPVTADRWDVEAAV